jgi:hypothetical protein
MLSLRRSAVCQSNMYSVTALPLSRLRWFKFGIAITRNSSVEELFALERTGSKFRGAHTCAFAAAAAL